MRDRITEGLSNMTNYENWKKHYELGLKLTDSGAADYALVNQLLKQNTDNNFQSVAYSEFSNIGTALYFSFHSVAVRCDGQSEEFYLSAMWERMIVSIARPLRLKNDSQYGAKSLVGLFVRVACERLGLNVRSAEDVNRVKLLFRAWLAVQVNGSRAERETVLRLRERLGNDAVRYADDSYEKHDVDVLIGGVPVSLKSYGAFGEKSFNSYRSKASHHYGEVKPVLYVNEIGAAAIASEKSVGQCHSSCWMKVPAGDGSWKRVNCSGGVPVKWDYDFYDSAELESVLVSVGAKNIPVPAVDESAVVAGSRSLNWGSDGFAGLAAFCVVA